MSLPRLVCEISRLEKRAEPPGRRVKNFNTGCDLRDGLTLAATGTVDARRHAQAGAVAATCRGRLRRGAICEERTTGFGAAAVKAVNATVSEWYRLLS